MTGLTIKSYIPAVMKTIFVSAAARRGVGRGGFVFRRLDGVRPGKSRRCRRKGESRASNSGNDVIISDERDLPALIKKR